MLVAAVKFIRSWEWPERKVFSFSEERKKSGAVEALEEEDFAFGFGKVLGDAGPDELACGVCHAAADDEALGTALLHHLFEEEGVQVGGSVR